MGRLESKHWLLIASFLTSTAAVIGGLDHWADLFKPAVVSGLIGQVGTLIAAVYAGAPPNPKWRHGQHPRRRRGDDTHVSDATRANLP